MAHMQMRSVKAGHSLLICIRLTKPPIKFDRWPTCNQSFSSSRFDSHLMDSSLFVSAGSSVATAAPPPPPFTSSQIPAMSLADY